MKLLKRGEILTREGETGTEFFFLVEGKIGAFRGHIKVAEFSEKGTVFGELAAILKKPRSLSLVAMEDSKLLVFDKGYEDFVTKHPDFAKRMLIDMAERLVTTTDKLWSVKAIINKSSFEEL